MTSLTLKVAGNPQAWNSFVASCAPHTFLHSWQWGQVQHRLGYPVRYWFFCRDEQPVAAALIITIRARRGTHYLIPHGPVGRSSEDILEALAKIRETLRSPSDAYRATALRVAPVLPDDAATHSRLTALGLKRSPLHVHAERMWQLSLAGTEDQLVQRMRKTTRHAIRRAEDSAVTTAILTAPSALARFLPLYDETAQRHQFVPYPETMLRAELEEFTPWHLLYVAIARWQGTDIAAAILVHFADTVYYHHGASRSVPGAPPASQLVQWAAIREARARSARMYNLWGIAPPHAPPSHPFYGITTFKKGFGGRELAFAPAYDLPLSWRYRQLWLVDTWRRLRRGF